MKKFIAPLLVANAHAEVLTDSGEATDGLETPEVGC